MAHFGVILRRQDPPRNAKAAHRTLCRAPQRDGALRQAQDLLNMTAIKANWLAFDLGLDHPKDPASRVLANVSAQSHGNGLMPKAGAKDRLPFRHQTPDQREQLPHPRVSIMHRSRASPDQPAIEPRILRRENPVLHRIDRDLPIWPYRLDHRGELLTILGAGLGEIRLVGVGHQERDLHVLPALHIYEPV